MKKLFLFISMVSILMTLFTVNVFAYDGTEIGKCNTSDPICVELQKQYGTDSTVLYSTVATANCTKTLTLSINGEFKVVYVSEKPTTGITDGIIPDSGIVGGIDSSTDMPTISLPQISIPSDDLLNSNDNNQQTEISSITVQILLIISIIINTVLVCVLVFTKKEQKNK